MVGKVHQALRTLGRTLDVLFEAEASCGPVPAHALILTAQAHMSLGETRFAEGAMSVALNMSSELPTDDCIDVMATIKTLCEAQGDSRRALAASECIYRIVAQEEKDPYVIASARADYLMAKMALGTPEGVAGPLAAAVKVLRKRAPHDGLVRRASVALAGLTKPKKRLRAKGHPEEA